MDIEEHGPAAHVQAKAHLSCLWSFVAHAVFNTHPGYVTEPILSRQRDWLLGAS